MLSILNLIASAGTIATVRGSSATTDAFEVILGGSADGATVAFFMILFINRLRISIFSGGIFMVKGEGNFCKVSVESWHGDVMLQIGLTTDDKGDNAL